MDILKLELERKRKEESEFKGVKKYIKRGDIEKKDIINKPTEPSKPIKEIDSTNNTSIDIPIEEIIKRLRFLGEPITLFGETTDERSERLRKLDSKEHTYGNNSLYQKALDSTKEKVKLEALKFDKEESDEDKVLETSIEIPDTTLITPELLESDLEKTKILIDYYLRNLLKDWETFLDERSDQVKLSPQGKVVTVAHLQSTEAIKYFFKNLKKNKFEKEIVLNITNICMYLQQREYLKANDAYLKLSIGNANWLQPPIGVTQHSMHGRKVTPNLSMIHKGKQTLVGYVLSDEKQRKWVQAIKRMMTFCQTKYPPSDLSKSMG